MQDLFYIVLDDKMVNYNKNTVSFKIKVKTNRFKEFQKKYKDFLKLANPKIDSYELKIQEIGKAIDKDVLNDKVKHEISLLKIILEDLKNGTVEFTLTS